MTTPPRDDLRDMLVRAELVAIVSIGRHCAPLSRAQVVSIACRAVWDEAQRVMPWMPPADIEQHLAVHAVRKVCEAQAGMTERALLIQRIKDLPRDQQMVYSLRYEHGLSDAQIGAVLDRSEDEIVALMLAALTALRGDDGGGPVVVH